MTITMEPMTAPSAPDPASPAAAAPHPSWWRRLLRPYSEKRTAKEHLHLLLDLPVGVAVFSLLAAMISTGFGSLITFIGIPILLLTVVAIRAIANGERARARALLEIPDLPSAPGLHHYASVPDAPWYEGLRRWFLNLVANMKQATFWKEFLYEALLMPWGIATFTVVVTVWATTLALVTTPLWGWTVTANDVWTGAWWQTAIATVLGLISLVIAPWIVRGVANLSRMATRGLLGVSAAELKAKIGHLSESRARSVDSATAERQRIERALHDGAQMRLTSLAMELGRAKENLATDPEGAATLIDEAHADAKLALVELRDLARGIHPSVLTDRGLDAAVHALAARAPIPVDVTVTLAQRPTPAVEATAYYVVAESLTNVSRHAQASRATVSIREVDNRIVVEVQDDGRGGAAIGEHDDLVPTGLRGLADRVAGVDGELSVNSPPGGPTVIRATVPCA